MLISLEPTSSSSSTQLESRVVEPSMPASDKQSASRMRRSRPRATHELDMPVMRKHEDNIRLLPLALNATLDSPYHTETIKTSAKIADMKTIKRTNTVAAQQLWRQQDDASFMIRSPPSAASTHDDTHHYHRLLAESKHPILVATSSSSRHRLSTTRKPWRLSQTMSMQAHRRTPLLNATAISLVTLLLVVAASLDCLTTPAGSSDVLPTPISAEVATAEALIGGKPVNVAENGQQNVIVIKYANVTTNSNEAGPGDASSKLNIYQLYNEPLSYSVMQSKFSQSLQLFDVSHNQLSALAKDLFCPLSSEVQLLNISHNLLENFDCLGLISKEGQVCLMYLRTLDMSYNLIKHVPDTGVASLHNLEVLNLSHNLIETLEEISLSTLFRLTRLDLSYNRIQQLPMRIFHKSSTMQVLKLQSNMLQNNINQMLMSGLISLEELNLSYNNISHVNELAFLDKPNLTRVDLSHNALAGLRQEALRVTVLMTNVKSQQQQQQLIQPSYKPRLHHNGEYAGLAQVNLRPSHTNQAKAIASVEFYLSSNPFVCDCQLDWMRKFQPAMRRSVLTTTTSTTTTGRYQHQPADSYDGSSYQSDQPVATVIQQQPSNTANGAEPSSATSSNNISENVQSNSQQQSSLSSSSSSSNNQQATISSNQQQQQQQPHYARIADLDLIKCSSLFRRNSHFKQQQQQHGGAGRHHHSRAGAPSDGTHHNLAVQVHHANNHLHHPSSHNGNTNQQLQLHHSKSLETSVQHHQSNMIDLVTADSSNFLCRYKSHCFALCHCCEFDACDCEMICPAGCNCYYDSKWETNIIDCSSNNHTVVPDRIPMDVSGLYLDGNNIDSLKPSNLIARKSLKTLYLNASNLQYIANRTFNGLIELQTLYLNDNMLRTLNGYEFEPLAQLRALYLQSNRLDHINNQTFNNLRSLEVLDLSNNRLTSMNLDLFGYIAHYNIRLRQLSLAHNWWSCQCNSINSFRHLLRQKFLVNGSVNTGVNIVDRNQLRCYYNSTTVGPLILDTGVASSSSGLQQQPIFGSFSGSLPSSSSNNNNHNRQQQQQQLTEINQCSDMIDDVSLRQINPDVNPPIIYPTPSPAAPLPVDYSAQPTSSQNPQQPDSTYERTPMEPAPYFPPSSFESPTILGGTGSSPSEQPWGTPRAPQMGPASSQPPASGSVSAAASVSLTSFVVATVLFVCIFVVAISVFVFIRQQQRAYGHHHRKKSSAASTTSVSSSASSTAISSAATQRHAHQLHHGDTGKYHHHHAHQLPQPPHFGHTLQQQQQQQLIMGQQHHQANNSSQLMAQAQHNHNHHQHHHHSASSQSNIYAALVPPTNIGGSSTVVTNIHHHQQGIFNNNNNNNGASNANNNLYSNSSTTASHHSSSNSSQHNGQSATAAAPPPPTTAARQHGNWMQQPIYGSQMHQHQMYSEGPYGVNASVASYKTGTSLYNGQVPPSMPGVEYRGVGGVAAHAAAGGDWISLPKVKHFMTKLVTKSLALGGYRASNSRDELTNITSDKIYDAFLSYDKRDEPFVMQYLSAELEYGSPQYRVADRYRDLPLPSSAYIAEAITSVIGCSHRTIIVLTENYLSSEWCRYELQAALRESALDKSHKLIAVVLDPKCLQEMDSELRNLLLAATGTSSTGGSCPLASGGGGSQIYQQAAPLVQLADGGTSSPSDYFQQQQLVTSLANPTATGNQQVCTQTAGARLTFINYNERKFWSSLKQLMPLARPSAQTLTLTTKN